MKVLVCDDIAEEALKQFTEAGMDVKYRPTITREELLKEVSYVDVLVVRSRTKVDASVLKAAKTLKVVGRAGVGLDNVDLDVAKQMGITVLNTPESSTEAVAELVIALMLSLARQVTVADSGIKRGEWLKRSLTGVELSGKTLGVIGMGRIGRRVAEICRAFNMKILGYDVIEIPKDVVASLGVEMTTLDKVFMNSDFITLHVPLSDQTRHMVNEERLRSMRRSAYIINASRGEVVDEKALLTALKEKWIAGAGLDVFEVEPPTLRELVQLDNCVCTPHIGGQTREAQRAAGITLAQKIIATLRGSN